MTLKAGSRGFRKLAEGFETPRWREALVVSLENEWLQCLVRCSRADREIRAQPHRERRGHFLLGGSSLRQTTGGSPRGMQRACSRPQGTSESRVDGSSFRGRTDVRHRLRSAKTSSCEEEEEEVKGEESFKHKFKRQLRGGDRPSSCTPQEMARVWYHRRRERKAGGFGQSLHQEEKKPLCHDREETQGFKARHLKRQGSFRGHLVEGRSQQLRSARRAPGLADSTEFAGQFTERPKAKIDPKFKPQQFFERERQGLLRQVVKGHSRAVKDYQGSKKKMFRNPVKHVKRYVHSLQEELGAQEKPFRLVDYNRRIQWGKHRSLQRCHYLVSVILEELLREEPERAARRAVLTLQALHQTSLDNGSWQIGWLLTHVEDPFEKKLFGGGPQSLQHVTSYLKSMSELAKTTQNLRGKGFGKGDQEEQEPNREGKGNKRSQKGKDKNKYKEQTDA